MIDLVEVGPVVEPTSWVLVFKKTASSRWMRWLAIGRYKHVCAYAYVPGLHLWIFYDVHLTGTDIVIARDCPETVRAIGRYTEDADLISMRRRSGDAPLSARWGFYCVPAMKSLIGLRCGALRPDALWRDCIGAGGVVLAAGGEHDAAQKPGLSNPSLPAAAA